ncbi:hypothetical protein A2188_01950 [Candidatus Woesebacteria bacterium RIFOXYA1_FULL_43_9]|uniref:UDP-glucose/GDP-mannose dehydrogenase dimerisation domain-containing protein n=1 Tax=Candidatus Woesebacteria bacterium RIFOXYA1_FULL_43_9 TaxID=1802534 RepID=A0A1F8CN73_9BACT|nr:MAG: hypothetical protein A2188_01950 [Candidatus Woesebacteria bacterium RIFOXYA1_FULL_43_9]
MKLISVGLLGCGEIGGTMAKICSEAGYRVLIKELKYDQIGDRKVKYLHVSIPEKDPSTFIKTVVAMIKKCRPELTIVNSSTTPGTTRKIAQKTKSLVVHSPVIGLHPHLYQSVKNIFPKIIGPVNKEAAKEAVKHFKKLGLSYEVYDNPEDSEAAKLLDLVYYAWNIVYCKWVLQFCREKKLNFEYVYTKHNKIYNNGYAKLLPNVLRPILIPFPGPIGGHCTIPDTKMIDRYYWNSLTKYILKQNKQYASEIKNVLKARQQFVKIRDKFISK